MTLLDDKVAIITGAAGAMGYEIASKFLENRCQVVLVDVDATRLEKAEEALSHYSGSVISVCANSADSEGADKVIKACISSFGRLDFLVPAAAIYESMPFRQMTDDEWRRTISINLDGVFYLTKRAVDVMETGAAIVMISSGGGHAGSMPEYCHYGASKGGILGFMRTLAKELAPDIRVNAVSPGFIDTPMVTEVMKQHGANIIENTPMHRMGKPSEIADAVMFLCSDQAEFIVGQALHVNGGAYIAG